MIPPTRYASPSENLMSCEKRLADHVSEENMVVSAHPRWSDGGDAGGHRLCTGFNNWHWVIKKWVTKIGGKNNKEFFFLQKIDCK